MSAETPSPQPRPWWQPGPFDYSSFELVVMRAAFALLAFTNIKWDTQTYTTQRNPTGLAHWFDLTWLASHPPGLLWKAVAIIGLVFYVLGRAPGIALIPICTSAVLIGTLVTSKVMHHSWHLITLLGLAQWVIYAWPKNRLEFLKPSPRRASPSCLCLHSGFRGRVCGLRHRKAGQFELSVDSEGALFGRAGAENELGQLL